MARINMKKAATKARNIRKRHPSMKWNTAMSQAMKSLGGKKKSRRKVGSVKKKSTRKKAVKAAKKYHAAEGRALRKLGSVSYHTGHAKSLILQQIEKAEGQKFTAKKKSSKRKIGKRIAALKARFRKLC